MSPTHERWTPRFHLAPRQGWLNDPNGLCQFHGTYHVFYQAAPAWPASGKKGWGHFASRDLVRWEDLGEPLVPSIPEDADGVYSGSALVVAGREGRLLGTRDTAETSERLGDLIVAGPDSGEPVPADEYLSGDVGGKIDHVERLLRDLAGRPEHDRTNDWLAQNGLELLTVIATDDRLAAAHELEGERANILQQPEFRLFIQRIMLHQGAGTRTATATNKDLTAR